MKSRDQTSVLLSVVQAFILWIHEKLFQMANFKHYFIVSFAKLFLAGCARKLSHLKPHSCYISYVQRTFFAEIYSLSHKWYQKLMGNASDLCFFSKKKTYWRSWNYYISEVHSIITFLNLCFHKICHQFSNYLISMTQLNKCKTYLYFLKSFQFMTMFILRFVRFLNWLWNCFCFDSQGEQV